MSNSCRCSKFCCRHRVFGVRMRQTVYKMLTRGAVISFQDGKDCNAVVISYWALEIKSFGRMDGE